MYYLSGFSGSAGTLIITEDRQILISDFRYILQISQEAPQWEFILAELSIDHTIMQLLSELHLAEVGFEAGDLSFARYQFIAGDHAAYKLRPTTNLVEELRGIKDRHELESMREAVRITDAAYDHLTGLVKPGVTERDLMLEAEWFMRRHGADAIAFPTIVATGDHSALPHAQPGMRILQPGDLVIVDMGGRYAHYCADMTRTFAVAEATAVAQDIYRVCALAQMAGVEQITAGMTGRDADKIVRDVIETAGYGEYFGHGAGHGVGLEVHEGPRLSRSSETPLSVGTTVTIEPGIYLPEIGGVRIEDLVVVRENGVEVLTAASKPLEVPVFG